MAKKEKRPGPNATIVEVLAHYTVTDRPRAQKLAEYLDLLEMSYAYELELDDPLSDIEDIY